MDFTLYEPMTTFTYPFSKQCSNLLHATHCVGCRGTEKAGGM